MLIKDIMTTPVVTIGRTASIAEAAALMLEKGISGLPVVDADGKLNGIVTEGDFLRRTELDTAIRRPRWLEYFQNTGRVAEEYVRSHGRKVEEVMQEEPVTCRPEDPLRVAVEAMLRRHIKRLPVVDEGRVVGIVARSDLLRALATLLSGSPSGTRSDEEIQAEIAAQFGGETWTSSLIEASVDSGVVTLRGLVFDVRQRQAARVLVENIAGVKSVVDDLLWIEPSTATVLGPDGFDDK